MKLNEGTNSMDRLEYSRLATLEIGNTIIWNIREFPLGIAHNSQHKTTLARHMDISSTDDMIGKIVNLKIVSEHMWYLKGEV